MVGRWEKMNSVFFQWHKILTGQASVMEHYKQCTLHEHIFVNIFWNKEKRLDVSPASIIFDGAHRCLRKILSGNEVTLELRYYIQILLQAFISELPRSLKTRYQKQ